MNSVNCPMPTIFIEAGFRFMIYVHDHAPAHVHIHGHGGVDEVVLDPLTLRAVRGNISGSEVRNALKIADKHKDALLTAWRTHHG